MVVIGFGDESCDVCVQIFLYVRDQAKVNPEVLFLKVDTGACPITADYYKIESVPEFVFRKNGYVVDRFVGNEEEKLENFITRNQTTCSLAGQKNAAIWVTCTDDYFHQTLSDGASYISLSSLASTTNVATNAKKYFSTFRVRREKTLVLCF